MTTQQVEEALEEGAPDLVEEWALRAAGGDLEALSQLYERFAYKVFRYAYVRVRDEHLAEEITARTWLRVCRSIGTYQTVGGGFSKWIRTIALNLIRDHAGAAKTRYELPTADMLLLDAPTVGGSPEEVAFASDARAAIADALQKLPKQQAACVTLRFFNQLSVKETAEELQVSESNVKQMQHRALKKLREMLPHLNERLQTLEPSQKGAENVTFTTAFTTL